MAKEKMTDWETEGNIKGKKPEHAERINHCIMKRLMLKQSEDTVKTVNITHVLHKPKIFSTCILKRIWAMYLIQ